MRNKYKIILTGIVTITIILFVDYVLSYEYPLPCDPNCSEVPERCVYPGGGYSCFPRDTTGDYDHCFSYKTDPEYGVRIVNASHRLNIEDCEWHKINYTTPFH